MTANCGKVKYPSCYIGFITLLDNVTAYNRKKTSQVE